MGNIDFPWSWFNIIIIAKPDKGVLVILSKQDYLKMTDILDNTTEFKTPHNVEECDKTTTEEQHIKCELLGFYNEHLIPKKICKKICPVGSKRP